MEMAIDKMQICIFGVGRVDGGSGGGRRDADRVGVVVTAGWVGGSYVNKDGDSNDGGWLSFRR